MGSGVSSDATVGVAQAMPDDAQIDPSQTLAALRREIGSGSAGRDEAPPSGMVARSSAGCRPPPTEWARNALHWQLGRT